MKKYKLFTILLFTIILLSACSTGATHEQYESVSSTAIISENEKSSLENDTTEYPSETNEPESATKDTFISESPSVETTDSSEPLLNTSEVQNIPDEPSSKAFSSSDLKFKVRTVISSSTSDTKVSINNITINENSGTDDENDYIVLAYLSFDMKNSAEMTKKMLYLLNNEIGANMAEIDSISELTIFWEVPYLNQLHDNVSKVNLLRNDSGFYFEEEWYDSLIFE